MNTDLFLIHHTITWIPFLNFPLKWGLGALISRKIKGEKNPYLSFPGPRNLEQQHLVPQQIKRSMSDET